MKYLPHFLALLRENHLYTAFKSNTRSNLQHTFSPESTLERITMRIRSAVIIDSCQLMNGVTGPPGSILNLHGGWTASPPSMTPERRNKKKI